MGNYAWLVCEECPEFLWLGKIYEEGRNGGPEFHRGTEPEPNWKRPLLNEGLWAFLADHVNHHLQVIDDANFDRVMTARGDSMREIGGDGVQDITFDEYLAERRKRGHKKRA